QRLAKLLKLAGVFALAIDKPMTKHLARRLQARGHQHCGPCCTVEPRYVFADEVHIGRPPLLKALVVRAISDGRNVVQKRVEPDVDCKLWIKGNPYAPALPCTSNVQIIKASLHHVQNFIPPTFRLDEVRMLIVKIEQLFLKTRLGKKITR